MQPINYPFKSDHEVVVALIEDFNNSVAEFNKQAINNSNDLLEIRKLLLAQNEHVDHRLTDIENELRDLNPKEIAKTVKANQEWITQFDNTKHTMWVIASVAFTVIGYLLNFVFQYIQHGK